MYSQLNKHVISIVKTNFTDAKGLIPQLEELMPAYKRNTNLKDTLIHTQFKHQNYNVGKNISLAFSEYSQVITNYKYKMSFSIGQKISLT